MYSPVTISYLKRWVQFWELYSTRRQGSVCPLPSLALPSSSPASKSSSSPRCPPWPPATPPHLLSLRPPWQFSPSPQYSLVWQRQRQGLIASALWRQVSCFLSFSKPQNIFTSRQPCPPSSPPAWTCRSPRSPWPSSSCPSAPSLPPLSLDGCVTQR